MSRPLAALALLAMACQPGIPKPDEAAVDAAWLDQDGDGYVSPDDCDDQLFDVNPAATEGCDGVDNDCDGEIDEAGTAEDPLWLDADGDGYGDPDAPADSCDAGEGVVTVAGDCDDTDATVYPDAEEPCDGVDNDCDGTTDEDAFPLWEDGDGDGYGDADSRISTCETRDGWVDDDTDCDDSDGTVYPGAPEVCGDGVDADCDGAPCRLEEGLTLPDDATVLVKGTEASQYTGKAIAIADIDGDDQPDLVVTSPTYDAADDLLDCGGAWVFYGPLSGDYTLDDYDKVAYGEQWSYAGYALTSLGDADGDGYDDLAFSTKDELVALVAGPLHDSDTSYDSAILIDGTLSDGMIPLGRVDDAGTGEVALLMGLPTLRVGGAGEYGRVLVFDDPLEAEDTDDARLVITSAEASEYTGRGVAGVADADGDGVHEILVGGPGADASTAVLQSGAVSLVPADESGEVAWADYALFEGDEARCLAGWAVADAGDWDGDGLTDVLIGGPGCSGALSTAGAAWVLTGLDSRDGWSAVAATFTGSARSDALGGAVAGVGDADADGYADVAVGAPGPVDASVWTDGEVGVWFGGVEGTWELADADLYMGSDEDGTLIGHQLAGGVDLTGDGLPDLAVAAPQLDALTGAVAVVPLVGW